MYKTYLVSVRSNDLGLVGVYVTALNKTGARRCVGGTIVKVEEVAGVK